MRHLLPIALVLLLPACAATGDGLLTIEGNRIVAAVGPGYDVQAPAGHRAAGPEHGTTALGSARSVGAWIGDDSFVLVLAERGGAPEDLSALPVFDLPCGSFRTRSFCAAYGPGDAAGADALSFLADDGFEVEPALRLRQLFRRGEGDEELVLTYGERVASCPAMPSAAAQAAFDARLLERVSVTVLGVGCPAPENY